MNEKIYEKTLEKINECVFMDGDKKRLTCEDALKISKELGIPAKDVGYACNQDAVKLADCLLGCFK